MVNKALVDLFLLGSVLAATLAVPAECVGDGSGDAPDRSNTSLHAEGLWWGWQQPVSASKSAAYLHTYSSAHTRRVLPSYAEVLSVCPLLHEWYGAGTFTAARQLEADDRFLRLLHACDVDVWVSDCGAADGAMVPRVVDARTLDTVAMPTMGGLPVIVQAMTEHNRRYVSSGTLPILLTKEWFPACGSCQERMRPLSHIDDFAFDSGAEFHTQSRCDMDAHVPAALRRDTSTGALYTDDWASQYLSIVVPRVRLVSYSTTSSPQQCFHILRDAVTGSHEAVYGARTQSASGAAGDIGGHPGSEEDATEHKNQPALDVYLYWLAATIACELPPSDLMDAVLIHGLKLDVVPFTAATAAADASQDDTNGAVSSALRSLTQTMLRQQLTRFEHGTDSVPARNAMVSLFLEALTLWGSEGRPEESERMSRPLELVQLVSWLAMRPRQASHLERHEQSQQRESSYEFPSDKERMTLLRLFPPHSGFWNAFTDMEADMIEQGPEFKKWYATWQGATRADGFVQSVQPLPCRPFYMLRVAAIVSPEEGPRAQALLHELRRHATVPIPQFIVSFRVIEHQNRGDEPFAGAELAVPFLRHSVSSRTAVAVLCGLEAVERFRLEAMQEWAKSGEMFFPARIVFAAGTQTSRSASMHPSDIGVEAVVRRFHPDGGDYESLDSRAVIGLAPHVLKMLLSLSDCTRLASQQMCMEHYYWMHRRTVAVDDVGMFFWRVRPTDYDRLLCADPVATGVEPHCTFGPQCAGKASGEGRRDTEGGGACLVCDPGEDEMACRRRVTQFLRETRRTAVHNSTIPWTDRTLFPFDSYIDGKHQPLQFEATVPTISVESLQTQISEELSGDYRLARSILSAFDLSVNHMADTAISIAVNKLIIGWIISHYDIAFVEKVRTKEVLEVITSVLYNTWPVVDTPSGFISARTGMSVVPPAAQPVDRTLREWTDAIQSTVRARIRSTTGTVLSNEMEASTTSTSTSTSSTASAALADKSHEVVDWKSFLPPPPFQRGGSWEYEPRRVALSQQLADKKRDSWQKNAVFSLGQLYFEFGWIPMAEKISTYGMYTPSQEQLLSTRQDWLRMKRLLAAQAQPDGKPDPAWSPKIKLVTAASEERPTLDTLRRSARISGVDLHVIGLGRYFTDYSAKVEWQTEFVDEHVEDDDIVIFVDAYDVILTPMVRFARQFLLHSETPIVFGAEPIVFPDMWLGHATASTSLIGPGAGWTVSGLADSNSFPAKDGSEAAAVRGYSTAVDRQHWWWWPAPPAQANTDAESDRDAAAPDVRSCLSRTVERIASNAATRPSPPLAGHLGIRHGLQSTVELLDNDNDESDIALHGATQDRGRASPSKVVAESTCEALAEVWDVGYEYYVKYLNSGVFIGVGKYVKDMLHDVVRMPLLDDQRMFTRYYLMNRHLVGLDMHSDFALNTFGFRHLFDYRPDMALFSTRISDVAAGEAYLNALRERANATMTGIASQNDARTQLLHQRIKLPVHGDALFELGDTGWRLAHQPSMPAVIHVNNYKIPYYSAEERINDMFWDHVGVQTLAARSIDAVLKMPAVVEAFGSRLPTPQDLQPSAAFVAELSKVTAFAEEALLSATHAAWDGDCAGAQNAHGALSGTLHKQLDELEGWVMEDVDLVGEENTLFWHVSRTMLSTLRAQLDNVVQVTTERLNGCRRSLAEDGAPVLDSHVVMSDYRTLNSGQLRQMPGYMPPPTWPTASLLSGKQNNDSD